MLRHSFEDKHLLEEALYAVFEIATMSKSCRNRSVQFCLGYEGVEYSPLSQWVSGKLLLDIESVIAQ